jgi:hypothetical protein
MPIIENRSYFDALDDEVGQLIKKIDPKSKQSAYRQSKDALLSSISRQRGAMFRFRKQYLSLYSVNDSVIIKVGPTKKGHLAAYRGKWVRVIWYGTYGFSMDCLVHNVKVSAELEQKLMLRGPYTKEEFTDEVAKAYPFPGVKVDDLPLIRSTKGAWVSAVPADNALENLEKDEIPDGTEYWKPTRQERTSLPYMVAYRKFAGFWIKTSASREEISSGELDWIPVGARVYVDRSGSIPRGWNVRTEDGWKIEE